MSIMSLSGFAPPQAAALLVSLTQPQSTAEHPDLTQSCLCIIDYTNSYSKVVYCLVYVIPLYFSAATRPSPTRSRDAPEAIRARILVVSLSTAVCSLVTLYLLSSHGTIAVREPLHFMGYWPLGLIDAARALGLTALLFAGPLYESLVIDGAVHQWLRLEPLRDLWHDWPTWRNLVAVRAI